MTMPTSVSETPVILEVAINGVTPPERNPSVPRTPNEIAQESLACLRAGAAIIHNHNDDPVIDMVTSSHAAQPYIDAWKPVLAEFPDAYLYPTMTGGGPHTTIEKRYGHLIEIADAGVLRMGIVDPGSVNLDRYDSDGAPAASDVVYINSGADVRFMVETCAALKVPVSFSIFDGSFMRSAVAYVRAGHIRHGGQIKIFFGSDYLPIGLPATEASLLAYLDILGDCPLPWSIALPGGDLLSKDVARLALERGGHLRIGIEDYAGPGQPTNLEILERAKELCASVGRAIATPAEAGEMMRSPS